MVMNHELIHIDPRPYDVVLSCTSTVNFRPTMILTPEIPNPRLTPPPPPDLRRWCEALAGGSDRVLVARPTGKPSKVGPAENAQNMRPGGWHLTQETGVGQLRWFYRGGRHFSKLRT